MRANNAPPRPMPPDFPAVAPTLSGDDLCRHYHAARATVKRWSDVSGVDWRGRLRQPAPPPDGFREIAPTMTQAELVRKYKRSGETVKRWARECGVQPKRIRKQYRKVDYYEEIRLCLSCPYPRCNGGNTNCPRLRAPAVRA